MAIERGHAVKAFMEQVGLDWPEANEDACHAVADRLATGGHAPYLDDDCAAAHRVVQRLLSTGQGHALDALGTHWATVKDRHFTPTAAASRSAAAAAGDIGITIAATKTELLAVTATLMAELSVDEAGAFVTGGAAAAAHITAARAQAAQVYRRGAALTADRLDRLHGDPSVLALKNVPAALTGGGGGATGGVAAGPAGAAGGGPSDAGVKVDHDEHRRAAAGLTDVSTRIHGRTTAELTAATGDLGALRGSGEFGAYVAGELGTVLDDLILATAALGDHLAGPLPDAVLTVSSDQRATDDANRRAFGSRIG